MKKAPVRRNAKETGRWNRVVLTDKVGRTAMIETNGSRSQRVRFGPRSAIAKALVGLAVGSLLIGSGCADLGERGHHLHAPRAEAQGPPAIPDRRISLGLDPAALEAHEAIMHAHLESVHRIVAALSRQDYARAREITEQELGFAKHREAMRLQNPQDFPSDYHDLAMAHHQAAEDLAQAIPSGEMGQILAGLERTIGACVACHRVYKR